MGGEIPADPEPLRPCHLCAIEDPPIYEESVAHVKITELDGPAFEDEADLCDFHKTSLKAVMDLFGRTVKVLKIREK